MKRSAGPADTGFARVVTLLALSAPLTLPILVAMTGCSESPASVHAAGSTAPAAGMRSIHHLDPPQGRINIGEPQRFRQPGVYSDFRESHGIYLVTHPQGFLVALSAICPHDHCGVSFEPRRSLFICPACGSRFTENGLVRGSSPARRALERYRLTRMGFYMRAGSDLYVDPGVSFRQDRQQWSQPEGMHFFEEPAAAASTP